MHTLSINIGDANVVLETGHLARNASGSVVVRHHKTVMLASVTVDWNTQDDQQFPLLVDYRERMAAAGKIPGNFFRREMRPSDSETLTCRLIDRSIRPLFPPGFNHPTTVSVTVFSADPQSDLAGLGILAASTAVGLSELPFAGPVVGGTVARDGDRLTFQANPAEVASSHFDLIMALGPDGLLMLEGGGQPVAHADILAMVEIAQLIFGAAIESLSEFIAQHGKPKHDWKKESTQIESAKLSLDANEIMNALKPKHWRDRKAKLGQLKAQARAGRPEVFVSEFDQQIRAHVRSQTLSEQRLDGRNGDEIRSLDCTLNPLPACHGSAVFTRGGTQVLASLIFGGSREGQDVETLQGIRKRRFILHYAFPGYSVGTIKRGPGGPGRREIGHGHLARRAVESILPSSRNFPFTARITADVLESDGSSSMATVCAASLALAMSGLPIRGLCAGIAIGVIIEGNEHRLLMDLTGEEDFFGDMDFKIAGTAEGVTAIQLDTKRTAIPFEILAEALEQASIGRSKILNTMRIALEQWRADKQASSESFALFKIDTGRVGHVIGSGGKNLQKVQSTTGAKVEVTRDGHVLITGRHDSAIAAARANILGQSTPLKEGDVHTTTVKSKKEYGVFVSLGHQDALVHTSELIRNDVDDYGVGCEIRVRVLGTDEKGRVKLSERAAASDAH